MSTRRLFESIVVGGLALTAIVETGAGCSDGQHRRQREGPPPMVPRTIEGRLVTASGAPVAGANVLGGQEMATTDAEGKFAITVLMSQIQHAVRLDFEIAGERVEAQFDPAKDAWVVPDAPASVDAGVAAP